MELSIIDRQWLAATGAIAHGTYHDGTVAVRPSNHMYEVVRTGPTGTWRVADGLFYDIEDALLRLEELASGVTVVYA